MLIIGCLVAGLSCGDVAPSTPVNEPPNDEPGATESTTAGAATDVDGAFHTRPRMVIYPDSLMLIGDTATPWLSTDQLITISNHTAATVVVTRIYIADDPNLSHARGDSAYFSIATPNLPLELPPKSSTDAAVTFIGDSKQRAALVVIETSYPGMPAMRVKLHGKVFTGW